MWGANDCLAMAGSANGTWATQWSDYDRSDAVSKAMNDCRKYGGTNCSALVSVCGRSPANGPQCIPYYPIDTSKGEGWKDMPPELRRRMAEGPNGACKPG